MFTQAMNQVGQNAKGHNLEAKVVANLVHGAFLQVHFDSARSQKTRRTYSWTMCSKLWIAAHRRRLEPKWLPAKVFRIRGIKVSEFIEVNNSS